MYTIIDLENIGISPMLAQAIIENQHADNVEKLFEIAIAVVLDGLVVRGDGFKRFGDLTWIDVDSIWAIRSMLMRAMEEYVYTWKRERLSFITDYIKWNIIPTADTILCDPLPSCILSTRALTFLNASLPGGAFYMRRQAI
jgi:hypothetical protein